MVFETRKSIENATTHLAAENITPAEIVKIEEIIEIQENNYRIHKSITQNDLDFHNTIARASRNKVLEILYYIISLFGQQSEIFEYLRKKVGAFYMVSNRKILETIKKRVHGESEKTCST